jgi:hypothetical protein
VREKAMAIIKERQLGVSAPQYLPGAALHCEYGEAPPDAAAARISQN